MTTIAIPERAAQRIAARLAERQAADARLADTVADIAAALGAPDGWQVRIDDNGDMKFAPPNAMPSEQESG